MAAHWLVKDAMARAVGEPRGQDAEGVLRIPLSTESCRSDTYWAGDQHRSYVHTLDPQRRPSPTRRALLFVATLIRKEVRPFTIKQIELAARDQTQTASSARMLRTAPCV